MKFVVWYCGRFVKAFDTKAEAHEWAKKKYDPAKIGDYRYCVVKEV